MLTQFSFPAHVAPANAPSSRPNGMADWTAKKFALSM
jgi:hypothetical protein